VQRLLLVRRWILLAYAVLAAPLMLVILWESVPDSLKGITRVSHHTPFYVFLCYLFVALFSLHYVGWPVSRVLKSSTEPWIHLAGVIAISILFSIYVFYPNSEQPRDPWVMPWLFIYLGLLLLFPIYGLVNSLWRQQRQKVG
jgi:hypothetical protein